MTKAYGWWKHENNLPFFFCARKRWENKLAGPFPSFPCCRNLLNSILELGRYALLTPSPPFISHLPVVNFFPTKCIRCAKIKSHKYKISSSFWCKQVLKASIVSAALHNEVIEMCVHAILAYTALVFYCAMSVHIEGALTQKLPFFFQWVRVSGRWLFI